LPKQALKDFSRAKKAKSFHFWQTISVSKNAKWQLWLAGNMVVVHELIRDVSREYHIINQSIFFIFKEKKKRIKN